MNKRTVISCIALLVVLLGGIATAVGFLYYGNGRSAVGPVDRPAVEARNPLFKAVPSDAAMLLRFDHLSDGLDLLTDSTKIVGSLVSESGKRSFRPFISQLASLRKSGRLRSLGRAGAVISLHYSGDLVPLMLVSVPKDTTEDVRRLLAAADSAKMTCRLTGPVAMISPAQTLVATAARHLDSGVSVLDQEGFPDIATYVGGSDALFFSHRYANQLFSAWLNRPYAAFSGFFASLTGWSGFSLDEAGSDRIRMKVSAAYGESTSYFLHVPAPGEARAASVLPASTQFAVDLPVSDIEKWIEGYRKYLDAAKKLDRYKSGNARLQKTGGLAAEQWARRLDIKEVAKAVIPADGKRTPLLFLRPGKADADLILKNTGFGSFKEYRPSVLPNPWQGYPSLLFGGVFALPDESTFAWTDGWMVVGDSLAVAAYLTDGREESLRSFLSSNGMDGRMPEKGISLLTYVAMDGDLADEVFRPALSRAWKMTLAGIAAEPAILSLGTSGSGLLTIDRMAVRNRRAKPGSPSVDGPAEAAVEVPQGPFKVRNSGTGKDNTFSQAPNLALQLRDENGKTLWSLPFGTPLCGYVQEVDWYVNGKIQFLFAAGSKLYLVDRLGRMVSGFPVDLGKEVALGPAVYDFSGAHGYTAVVLHKDNTVGMYDLHGRSREGWLGIACDAPVTGLPELVTTEGKKYWIVPTTAGTPSVFNFLGGEPVSKAEARKILKTLK